MSDPSMESLTRMALLETTGENTEVLSLREEVKRKEYFDKFHVDRNKHHKNAIWGIESKATGALRCNGNVVLLQIGAKIPASTADNRRERDVAPIYTLPRKTLGAWGIDNLRSNVSEYKGMDRISLSEPTRICLLYTSPSPRDISGSRMPSSA